MTSCNRRAGSPSCSTAPTWRTPGPATRRAAAAAKRGELLLGCFAVGVLTAIVVALWWVSVHEQYPEPPVWVTPLVSVGLWSTALLWTALLLRVVTQNESGRPLGLIWDLMCFLPRSAHPFGPPCYAERAVPELAARVRRWLDGDSGADGTPRGPGPEPVVVLSAHSLGAVLAVATIFTEDPDADPRTGRAAHLRRAAASLLRPVLPRAARARRPGHGALLGPEDPLARAVDARRATSIPPATTTAAASAGHAARAARQPPGASGWGRDQDAAARPG